MSDVTERAERLRVLLAVAGDEPALTPTDALALGLPELDARDYGLLADATHDDRCLAWELHRIGAAMRGREYRALESLLALVPGGTGTLDEQVLPLPECQRLAAISHVLDLGWVN